MATKVADVVERYNKESLAPKTQKSFGGLKATVEFEIRFKEITRELFFDLYKSVRSDATFEPPILECSVSAISPNDGQQIRRIFYVDGVRAREEYSVKKQLLRSSLVVGPISYFAATSIEAPTDQFKSPNIDSLRYKRRVSFVVGHWRVDFTVSNMSAPKDVKAVVAKVFTSTLSPDTLEKETEGASWNLEYEIEAEYIGPVGKLTAGSEQSVIATFMTLLDPKYAAVTEYKAELEYLARIIQPHARLHNPTLKQITNQVMELTKNSYITDVYPKNSAGYFLTDKADGERCVASLHDGKLRVLTTTLLTFEAADGVPVIVDAELVKSKDKITLYVFDVMLFDKTNVAELDFAQRIEFIPRAVEVITKTGVGCMPKQYQRIPPAPEDEIQSATTARLKAAYESVKASGPYETDGIIIVEPGKNYIATRNYKWKPTATIDFLAVKCPPGILGVKPYVRVPNHTLYFLFNGASAKLRESSGIQPLMQYKELFPDIGYKAPYAPMQFAPSLNPLAYLYWHDDAAVPLNDRQIVELSWDATAANASPQRTGWVFHRIREDRAPSPNYYGNDFRIAELTFSNFIDVFRKEDLWNPPSNYFNSEVEGIYRAGNRYRRAVTAAILKEYISQARRVIDSASGRGAALHQYQHLGVSEVLFTDKDPTAISELIRRNLTIQKKAMIVHAMVIDLTEKPDVLIAGCDTFGFVPGGVDGVVCDFALHYLCDTEEHLLGFMTFVGKMLKRGGAFIFTVMDGEKIFELLRDKDSWQGIENGVVKHLIEKQYNSTKLANVGQLISVKLPFSTEMYEEPLCNIAHVAKVAKTQGLVLERRDSFADYLPQNAKLSDGMTDLDKEYTGLYSIVVLKKK